jgi:hypothetical protein
MSDPLALDDLDHLLAQRRRSELFHNDIMNAMKIAHAASPSSNSILKK